MSTLNIESLITDLALILVLGAIAILLFKKLKQPVVLGYIVAGFLASPHFALLPSVASEANIEFWAQIGIIVLLFSLGLEFSFKKLMNVGGSAIVTTLIIVLGMMSVGFVTGKLLQFSAINCLFLGGMLSMSSTTIIIKALGDLNMRQRRFVPGVFAVLIVEDLFAVVMMVLLSSVAINKTVEGRELLASVLKLVFFLVIWFTVGVFVIPSVFKRYRNLLTDEIMLVMAMGLCFLMAVFSVKSGFSMALGAFVMGSILAGTSEAERIERIVSPVKDLFGAVFFISVGMMVNPTIIMEYAGTIALLSVVVIVGMILFGTFGKLATGQSLKVAIESGFCLTQIGEFSFIIATLGLSLGVLESRIYPIVVAVSVITTFFTPFFIKQGVPCYEWVAKHLPSRWQNLLYGYSKGASESETSASKKMWKTVLTRFLVRLLLYSVIVIALIIVSRSYFIPFMRHSVLGRHWGKLAGTVLSALAMAPFLYAIIMPSVRRSERQRLVATYGRVIYMPLVVMVIINMLIAMAYMMSFLYGLYSSLTTLITVVSIAVLVLLLLSPHLRKKMEQMESRFVGNMNEREYRRTGKANNLVSDLHLAYMKVGYDCPFVGCKLCEADIRRKYGVNVVYIQRNSVLYPVPKGDTRIFPGDVLGVIGNDEQIQHMLPLVEATSTQAAGQSADDVKFLHFSIGDKSPLVGLQLEDARLREDYSSLLVAVQRKDEFVMPTPELTFGSGDVLWIVGNVDKLKPLKG